MENINKNDYSKYEITDEKLIQRLNIFKDKLEKRLNKEVSVDELIAYLNISMNCDSVQLRSVENEINGITTTLEEDLQYLFEMETDERIFIQHDCMSNVDEENLKDVMESYGIFPNKNKTEDIKRVVECKYEPQLSYGWDSRLKRPSGTNPCGKEFEISADEVFFDSDISVMRFLNERGMGSFRTFYQVCPNWGFIVLIDKDLLTKEEKESIEKRCLEDRDLFRKLCLFSELSPLDISATPEEKTALRRRLIEHKKNSN